MRIQKKDIQELALIFHRCGITSFELSTVEIDVINEFFNIDIAGNAFILDIEAMELIVSTDKIDTKVDLTEFEKFENFLAFGQQYIHSSLLKEIYCFFSLILENMKQDYAIQAFGRYFHTKFVKVSLGEANAFVKSILDFKLYGAERTQLSRLRRKIHNFYAHSKDLIEFMNGYSGTKPKDIGIKPRKQRLDATVFHCIHCGLWTSEDQGPHCGNNMYKFNYFKLSKFIRKEVVANLKNHEFFELIADYETDPKILSLLPEYFEKGRNIELYEKFSESTYFEVRISVVRSISSKDDPFIQYVALHDSDYRVRIAAIELIDNEEVLRAIVLTEKHFEVRKIAVRRLNDEDFFATFLEPNNENLQRILLLEQDYKTPNRKNTIPGRAWIIEAIYKLTPKYLHLLETLRTNNEENILNIVIDQRISYLRKLNDIIR